MAFLGLRYHVGKEIACAWSRLVPSFSKRQRWRSAFRGSIKVTAISETDFAARTKINLGMLAARRVIEVTAVAANVPKEIVAKDERVCQGQEVAAQTPNFRDLPLRVAREG